MTNDTNSLTTNVYPMADLIYKEEAFKAVGICMKILQTLGMGLKEINYKEAMEIEFLDDKIPYEREKKFTVKYKERILRNPYIADFVVFDSIIIEVKSASSISERSLTWKRIVL